MLRRRFFEYLDRHPRGLEDNVIFKNLGLAVIDEQHKFGVAQRAQLWKQIPYHRMYS